MRPLLQLAALLLTLPVAAQQPAPDPRPAAGNNPQADKLSNNLSKIRQAEDLLEHGDYKAAEPLLAQLAVATPQDASQHAHILFDLGFTEEHNNEDTAAAGSYTAAIAADPTLPEPHVALGLLLARAGEPAKARTEFDVALKLTAIPPPLRARALRALARLNETTAPTQATEELLEATRLTGEQPGDAELSAGLALRSGNTAEAEAAYQRLLLQAPNDPEASAGLVALLQHEGKLGEADAALGPALAAHPDDPRLNAQAASLEAAAGKPADARKLLEQLRSRSAAAAADPGLTRLLAHLDLVTGDTAAADPLYRSLLTASPSDPTLLDDLGSTLVREQKFAEAQAVLAQAVGLRPAFHDDTAWAETAGHLAFAASRNHQPEVALQALSARATVLPNSAATLFLEATAHDALHQNKQAAASYRAFLAMAKGKLPNEEFEARHRLVALEHEH